MNLTDHVEDYEKKLKGNWRKFDSFCWFDEPDAAESWCIYYTHNRDSGLVAESNASVIDKALDPLTMCGEREDARRESHHHWAVGHVDGWAVRVRTPEGELTPAFLELVGLLVSLEDYPILDESDYSDREYQAAIMAIGQQCRYEEFKGEQCPEIFAWLWDNEQSELENKDDQGAYPSREAVERAATALGFMRESEAS